MSGRLNYDRVKPHRGFEPAFIPPKKPAPGGWTHLKRQPVKTYTAAERAVFMQQMEAA